MLEGFLLDGCKGRGVSQLYKDRQLRQIRRKLIGSSGSAEAEAGSGGFGEVEMASGMATGGVDAGSGRTGRKGDEDGPLETVATILHSLVVEWSAS